jgi:Uma2 family endonuclease
MALPRPESFVSEEEYLKFEESSEFKHEYANGQIFDMTGGSIDHSTIKSNTDNSLNTQLAGTNCRSVNGDLRVKIESWRSYRYPDVMVFCGPGERVGGRNDTISNPVVVIEVLSPSTQMIDRNEKLHEYTTIPSLQEYLLISQDTPLVEHYLRQEAGGWLFTTVRGLDGVLELPSIGCKLVLAEVYQRVTFEVAAEAE